MYILESAFGLYELPLVWEFFCGLEIICRDVFHVYSPFLLLADEISAINYSFKTPQIFIKFEHDI